jgi:hypothetical protein
MLTSKGAAQQLIEPDAEIACFSSARIEGLVRFFPRPVNSGVRLLALRFKGARDMCAAHGARLIIGSVECFLLASRRRAPAVSCARGGARRVVSSEVVGAS